MSSFEQQDQVNFSNSLNDDSLIKTLALVNYPGNFAFQERRGSINWKAIYSIDMEKIISELDIHSLEGLLHNITFSFVDTTEIERYGDLAFVKLFRLLQLTTQYLIWTQDYLEGMVRTLDSQYKLLHQQFVMSEERGSSLIAELMESRKELKIKQKIISTYEYMMKRPFDASLKIYKCRICSKKFVSKQYLESHLEKQHKQQLDEEAQSYEYSIAGMQTMERDVLKETVISGTSAERIQRLLSSYQEQSKNTVQKIDALYDHFNQEISFLKTQKKEIPKEEEKRAENKRTIQRQEDATKSTIDASNLNVSQPSQLPSSFAQSMNQISVNVDLKPCFEELRLMMQDLKPSEEEIEARVREKEIQKEELKEIVENTVKQHIRHIQSSRKEKAQTKRRSPAASPKRRSSKDVPVKLSDLKQDLSKNSAEKIKEKQGDPKYEQLKSTTREVQPVIRQGLPDPKALFQDQELQEEIKTEKASPGDNLEGTAQFNKLFTTGSDKNEKLRQKALDLEALEESPSQFEQSQKQSGIQNFLKIINKDFLSDDDQDEKEFKEQLTRSQKQNETGDQFLSSKSRGPRVNISYGEKVLRNEDIAGNLRDGKKQKSHFGGKKEEEDDEFYQF